jgi:beta-phosphoglucomutase
MTLDAVVFDFDGVLADTEPLHLRIYQALLGEEGLEFSAAEYYDRYLGFDDVGVFEALSRDKGLSIDGDRLNALIGRKTDLFQTLVRSTPVLFPGTAECLTAMAATCPIAIASGALRHEIEIVLASGGLRDMVPVIVAAGDTPLSKPAPDPYVLAIQRLASLHGRPIDAGRSVAIEDSRWGLESARMAGLRTVGVTTSYKADQLGDADLVLPDISGVTPDRLRQLLAATSATVERGRT